MDIPGVEESKGGDSEDIDFYDNTVPLPKMPQKSYKTMTHREKRVFQLLAARPSYDNWTSASPVDWSEEPVAGSDSYDGKCVFVSDFCLHWRTVLERKNSFGILPIEEGSNSVPAEVSEVFESTELLESRVQQPREKKQSPTTVPMSVSCFTFTRVILFIMSLITGWQSAVVNAFVAFCKQIAVVSLMAYSNVVVSGVPIAFTGFCLCVSMCLASITWKHFRALGARHSTFSLLLFCIATGVAFLVFVHDAFSCIFLGESTAVPVTFTAMALKTYEFGSISSFWQHAIGLVLAKLALPFILAVLFLLKAVASEPLSLLLESLTDDLVSALLFFPRFLVLLLLQLHAYCYDRRFKTGCLVDLMGVCRTDYPANLVGCVRICIDDEDLENMDEYIPARIF
jgi:hypothetical protein